MSAKSDLNKLIREYRQQGWTVEVTGGGHLKWTPPHGGVPIFSGKTLGDQRSLKNTMSQLKRAVTNPSVPCYKQ